MIKSMIYILRQNFGRYLLVIIERDSDNEENDLALAVRAAEAEEITAKEVNIQDKQSERSEDRKARTY